MSASTVVDPYFQQLPGDRIRAVLADSGWNIALTTIDDGFTMIRPWVLADDNSENAFEHIMKTAQAEGGSFIQRLDGFLSFRTANVPLTSVNAIGTVGILASQWRHFGLIFNHSFWISSEPFNSSERILLSSFSALLALSPKWLITL